MDHPTPSPSSFSTLPVWAWLGVVVCLAVGIWIGTAPLRPPSSGPDGFSIERALAHVEEVATAPRPMGSEGHAAAREYLAAQLTALGFETEIQEETLVSIEETGPTIATVRNVIGRKNGSESGRVILLAAHYDSVPLSPGAGDNGAALGAVLEALRTIDEEGGARDDVVVLFADGEEVGLLGARTFVERHRWAEDIDLVANFDARGASGGAIMFQTSPGDGTLIRPLGRVASAPILTSATEPLYGLMPNDTDFTVYEAAGLQGYNIAFIGDGHAYHRPSDGIETLSPASVRHVGAYALDLLRGSEGVEGRATALTYFTLFGQVIALGPVASLILLLLALASTAGVLWIGTTRHGVSWRDVARGVGVVAAVLGLAVVVAFGIDTLATSWVEEYALVMIGPAYVVGVVVLSAGLSLILAARLKAFRLDGGVRLAGLLVWSLLAVAAYVFVPQMAYLVAVPLLFASLALAVWPSGETAAPGRFIASFALASLPFLALVLPVAGMALVAFNMVPVIGAIAFGIFFGLTAVYLAPAKWLGASAAGLVVIGLGAVVGTLGWAAGQPSEHESLLYLQQRGDADGIWASRTTAPPVWAAPLFEQGATASRLDAYYPISPFEFMTAQGEASKVSGVDLVVVSDSVSEARRSVRMSVRPDEQVPIVYVFVRADLQIESARVGETEIDGGDWAPIPSEGGAWYVMTYRSMPADGIDLDLELTGFPNRIADAVPVMAIAHHFGLPEGMDGTALDAEYGTRPEDNLFMYSSIVSTTGSLGTPPAALPDSTRSAE